MLFRTVYGPELAAIYHFIASADKPLARRTIHAAFLVQSKEISTQSVDDALSFLESAYMIEENGGNFQQGGPVSEEPFRIKLLCHLRALERGQLAPHQPVDPLYLLILSELFIHPNQLFVADVHSEANKLRQVTAAGGLSREKLQAWKRVMEFLGVGQRVAGGFRCAYTPQLLRDILTQWAAGDDTLQQFLEGYLDDLLPCQTVSGYLAHAVEAPLSYLDHLGLIALTPLQDSPTKPYFGERKLRHIRRQEVADVIV